ncbi:hypothetical protein ACFPVT_05600 [Corynebacterium choanae]|uniref:FCS-type domain-containing protein n=1 Tax=Corynebacterium choanae TaxID=1862358 RepID=A0A3G6J617_9CORY|nr:hypothetical protein [Corynebacterium choanae]AZA13541.1 hypothetical protein CCHOA_05705 [Corynebacterium choanae]
MITRKHGQQQAQCAWCAKPIIAGGRGRPRKYCSHSCRQRAYEQRVNVTGTQIPSDAVIITQERASIFSDQLFQLRCAAEDIHTAAAERAPYAEIAEMCAELVVLAENIERLRIRDTDV